MFGWWTKLPRSIQRLRLMLLPAVLASGMLLAGVQIFGFFKGAFYVSMIPMLFITALGMREAWIIRKVARANFLICPRCEYKLDDVIEQERCPECGTAFTPASLRKTWSVRGEPKV